MLVFVIAFQYSHAQARWDGEANDGLWNTASNWVGNIVPASTDDVVLDNTFFASPVSITLPAGAVTVTVNTLVIHPGGSFTITLILPSSNTANPGLNITGSGDALVLYNNAIIKNSSGGSAGSGIDIVNTFRINNGGRYIHNTSRGNAAIVSRLSTVAGTELGVFEYDVPGASTIASLSNRTYGTLEFSAAANGANATYIGSGANPLNVNGHLYINSGVTLSISMSANFIVHQNYQQASSSIFNLQSSSNNNIVNINGNLTTQGIITESGSGSPVLELNGSTNQNISVTGAGAITNSVELKMNNAAGATLLSPLILPANLTLTTGKIKTDAINVLSMADNSVVSGGSINSFISGPMKKIGDDNFIFPVGLTDAVGSIYAPIGISGTGGSVTDEFIAEYKRANPQSTSPYTATHVATLDHISYVEYWTLKQNNGASAKKVSLEVNLTSFCRDLAHTYVSRWDGSLWTNEGSTVTSGPVVSGIYETGRIESVNNISGLISPAIGFTLATDLPYTGNPLPVGLISFNAVKINTKQSSLTWELAACCSKDAKFEIQRAGDDLNFNTIAVINGNETSRFYSFDDKNLKTGTNYYRLEITDADGSVVYSRIAIVLNGIEGLFVSMSPTVVITDAVLSFVSSSEQQLGLVIIDMQGRVVRRLQQRTPTGKSAITFLLNDIKAGVYQLIINNSEGQREVIRFVKQ